jgi:hypothetical protein
LSLPLTRERVPHQLVQVMTNQVNLLSANNNKTHLPYKFF